jgi:BirA family biotin operon repressor/biotin-[acetyl-CoA-carboxylase] ligase
MSRPCIDADAGVATEGLRACEAVIHSGDCRSVRYYAEIDSTNTAACRDLTLENGFSRDSLPRLYLADRQTSGRGRLGRSWIADEGTLTFSILYQLGDDSDISHDKTPLVALATGVAIARTIEYLAAPISAKIKWPNDVHVGGGKVAGVLVESVANHPHRLVIGVGLNVATRLENHSDSIVQPAQSLSQIARGPTDRNMWLAELISQIAYAYRQLRSETTYLVDELRQRCLLTGTSIRYQRGEQSFVGRCIGIDDHGAILVKDASGIKPLLSGEVWQIRQSEANFS